MPTPTTVSWVLQVGFKRTLLQDVKLFVVDAVAFRQDWDANGPTVPGLDPMDATDRLRKFQQLFEVRASCQHVWQDCKHGHGGSVLLQFQPHQMVATGLCRACSSSWLFLSA